ncbi:hypothetical protein TcWFU_007451 [Taenia crassiceps]|uniref:Uncharacterized protein n=1 Tax=Taenia crassiceps TaxID=6207 RepID=A0ABR4QSE9_9CEST
MDSKYYDLGIPRETVSPELIARLLDCEYLYMGISTTVSVDEFNFKDKKRSAKESRQQMRVSLAEKLTPLTVSELTNLLEQSEQFRSSSSSRLPTLTPPRLFNRLTLTCVDVDTAGLFFKEFEDSIRKFDIVAFEPMSSAALAYVTEALSSLPIDLITIDPAQSFSSDFRPTGKQCTQCFRRGVYFDLPLSPALFRSGASSSARIALATLLTHLNSVCRFQFSRLVVVTSGAQTGWEVRRPQAVASVLRAICPTVVRGSTSLAMQQTNPWQALSHGLTRCESKTSHGAAILMRLLADPSVVEVVQVSVSDEANVNEEKSPLPSIISLHRSSATEETDTVFTKTSQLAKLVFKHDVEGFFPIVYLMLRPFAKGCPRNHHPMDATLGPLELTLPTQEVYLDVVGPRRAHVHARKERIYLPRGASSSNNTPGLKIKGLRGGDFEVDTSKSNTWQELTRVLKEYGNQGKTRTTGFFHRAPAQRPRGRHSGWASLSEWHRGGGSREGEPNFKGRTHLPSCHCYCKTSDTREEKLVPVRD